MSSKAPPDVVKKLPQLSSSAPSRTPKRIVKNFLAKEINSSSKSIDWHERKKSPSPLPVKELSRGTRPGRVSRQKTSDEIAQQGSEMMFESCPPKYSMPDGKEQKHTKTPEGSNQRSRHKATINTFPYDPPFDFQLESSSRKGEDEGEAEDLAASSSRDSDQRSLRTESPFRIIHQHQRFSPTPSFDSGYHNLHECPFYTNEVSDLKFQIIELEYINATLENKVRKYRDEIRLFKQDIKGYKLDGRQFAALLLEREKEIQILHEKITQLLNREFLPLPPRSTPSSVSRNHKRYGHMATSSVDHRDFGHSGGSRNHSHVVEDIGRAETDDTPQSWV